VERERAYAEAAWKRWVAETAPPLPQRFHAYTAPFRTTPPAGATSLIVVTGIPGTGKSTIAESVGSALAIPVFGFDWVLGAIVPRLPGVVETPVLAAMGFELLITLALRQLAMGQSAILDLPGEDPAGQRRLESLAERFTARLKVIECICSDLQQHRQRVEGRQRHIPGWNQTVPWSPRLLARRETFRHWDADTLVLDAVDAAEQNIRRALEFIAQPAPPAREPATESAP
jgi:hypothetical protein